MDIIQTCETIELWINSCKTREQLELLEYVIMVFISRARHSELTDKDVVVQRTILLDKIFEHMEKLSLNKVTPVLTNQ